MKYNVLMHDVYTALFVVFAKLQDFHLASQFCLCSCLGLVAGKKADQENENAGVSEIRSFCSRGTIYILGP